MTYYFESFKENLSSNQPLTVILGFFLGQENNKLYFPLHA